MDGEGGPWHSSGKGTKTEMTADDIIRQVDVKPHPEGGHFRETFRDANVRGGRAASTAIYYCSRPTK